MSRRKLTKGISFGIQHAVTNSKVVTFKRVVFRETTSNILFQNEKITTIWYFNRNKNESKNKVHDFNVLFISYAVGETLRAIDNN